MKYLILSISLFLVYSFPAYSREIKPVKLMDLSNKEYKSIWVKENPANDRIYLINKSRETSDTIEIAKAAEVDTVKVSLGRFVEVVCRVRVGSGEHLRVTKVFCVDDNRLKESLSAVTFHESYSPEGILQEKYSVRIRLNYKNGIYSADLLESFPVRKNVIRRRVNLSFDSGKLIFFSGKHKRHVIVCDSDEKQQITEYYEVSLLKESYVYSHGVWYQRESECYRRM